jgi:tetratricopeptide (TPR) repeat protein
LPGSVGRIPRLVARAGAAEMRGLPLTPVDGFVLSRVDGRLTARDLAASTGLSEDQVSSSLDKLAELKVVAFGPPDAGPPPGATPPPESAPQASPVPPLAAPLPPPPAGPAAQFAVADDAPELQEATELDLDVKKRILGLFTKLGELDHYELLNLERACDKKAIKRSYFEFAAVFHPDKYFRKEIGSFKGKMEAIFGRATQAYEILSDKTARADYDVYLADHDRTRGLDAMLRSALDDMAAAEEAADSGRISGPPVASVSHVSVPTPGFGLTETPRPAGGPSPVQIAAAQRALAARLMGGRAPRQPSASQPPAGELPKHDPGGALKRLHEDRVAAVRRVQLNKYLAMAAEAEKKKDVIGTAQAYRVVLSVVGDDQALREKAEKAILDADVALADTFQRQAQYEERSQSWPEAARSWGRVAAARPSDARAHDRAANAITRAEGDLHQAAELAKKAIALDGSSAAFRLTLANVYVAAGLLKNARRELEAALQLSPQDDTIAALLKRVPKT